MLYQLSYVRIGARGVRRRLKTLADPERRGKTTYPA